jgi:hypothetical protein
LRRLFYVPVLRISCAYITVRQIHTKEGVNMKAIIKQVERAIEVAENLNNDIAEGERGYSEAGEYYYDYVGDVVISALHEALRGLGNGRNQ